MLIAGGERNAILSALSAGETMREWHGLEPCCEWKRNKRHGQFKSLEAALQMHRQEASMAGQARG